MTVVAAGAVTVGWYDRGLDDDRAICELHQRVRAWQVAQGEVEVFGDDSRVDLSDIAGHYLTGGNFWVARLGDRTPVGMVGLLRIDRETAAVKRFAVDPEYQGRGIGTALLAELMTFAESMAAAAHRPVRRLVLATGERERGMGLYRRVGFRVTGWDPVFEDYLMAVDL